MSSSYLSINPSELEGDFSRIQLKERLIIGLTVTTVLLLTAFDIVEDAAEHHSSIMILGDVLYTSAVLAVLLYLWQMMPYVLKKRHAKLSSEIILKHKDVESWQTKANDIMRGFSVLVTRQLEEWKLTRAEKEVALLLLKGLSVKEIALVRDAGQNTVRQQASSIYKKAGLTTRSELSAFFLEDLLVLSDEQNNRSNPSSIIN